MAGDIVFGIRLQADGREFVGEMRASEEALRRIGGSAGAASKDTDRLAGAMQRAGHYAAGLIGINFGASLVRQAVATADAFTRVESRLRLVTGSAAEAAAVQTQLYAIAQQTRQGYLDLADVYAQVARASADTGISQQRLIGISTTLSQAVALSGGSAESARAAMVQLSQGLASGTLRGEELNSVIEQTPRLAQALAQGLGLGIGELRKIAGEGRLTTDAVLGALERAAGDVEAEFRQLTPTVSEAFTQWSNAGGQFIDTLNEISGATASLAGFIADAAAGIDRFSGELRDATAAGLSFWEALKGIGLSDPFANQAEHIARLRKEIQELQAAKSDEMDRRPITELNQEIALRQKLIDYYQRRQKAEADAAISSANLDANDRRLAQSSAAAASASALLGRNSTATAKAIKDAAKAADELARSLDRWYDGRAKGLATLDDEIAAEHAVREAMGLSRDEIKLLEAAKDELAASAKQVEAANLAEAASFAGPLAGVYKQAAKDAEAVARKLRELAAEKRATAAELAYRDDETANAAAFDAFIKDLLEREKAIDEAAERSAQASARYWNDISADVAESLTDAVVRGGEDGLDLLKRAAAATALRVTVIPFVQSGVNAALGAIGLGPGGAGGAGAASLAANLGSSALLGGLSGAGGFFGQAALGFSGASTSSLIAAGNAAMGAGQIGAGLGSFVGAAAPWALAAYAVLDALGAFEGPSPHRGGAAYAQVGGASGLATAGNTGDFGLDWGAFRSGRGGDRSAAVDQAIGTLIDGVAGSIATRAARYGGDAAGLTVTGRFAADGKDPSIGAWRVAGPGGAQFDSFSKFGKDGGTAFQAYSAEAIRAEVAALQSIPLSGWIEALIDAVDPAADSLDTLTRALAAADEVAAQVALADQLRAGLSRDAAEDARLAGLSAASAWFESSERIQAAAAGGAFSLEQLGQIAEQHYRNQVALLASLERASADVAGGFADAARGIQYQVLDTAGRYDFLRDEADKYLDVISALMDPAEITQYAAKLRQDVEQAFALLDPAQQQRHAPEFLTYLEGANDFIQERISAVTDAVAEQQQTQAEVLGKAIAEQLARVADVAVAGMQRAADAVPSRVAVGGTLTINLPGIGSFATELGDG